MLNQLSLMNSRTALAYGEGLQARSWIEYSLLEK
jgi:hypothetical protein